MRHGPVKDIVKETDQLFEWTQSTGAGIFNFPFRDEVPGDCMEFVLEQFAAFHVPIPSEIMPLLDVAAFVPFDVVDGYSPYLVFSGMTDVDVTDDWAKYAYEVVEGENGMFHSDVWEVNPEKVETFIYRPGRDKEIFFQCLENPGLDNLPEWAGLAMRECAGGGWHMRWERVYDMPAHLVQEKQLESARCVVDFLLGEHLHQTQIDQIRYVFGCPPTGHDDTNFIWTVNAYIELAMWASFLWFIGPHGRWMRAGTCEIFDACYAEGECLLTDGVVIGPSHYRKLEREPRSCYKCSVAAWCIEATATSGSFRYICEACSSEGMPVFRPANCGSKFCKYLTCPHHPDHALGNAGVAGWYQQHGQLAARTAGWREERGLVLPPTPYGLIGN